MIELRFHHELYDGFAIDEATKVYASHATLELVREPDAYLVRVTAAKGVDERALCGELSNYALGLTVDKQLEASS